MKTSILLSVLAFLSVCNLYSQEKDYEFNRLNTRKQTLRGQSASDIYSVSYVKIEESINPEYTKLLSELTNVIADSVSVSTNYYQALIKFNDISTIKRKIVDFKKSTEPFGNKVILLKEAQILASKHNIKELLYSDNDINKEMKAGFLLLRLNENDLNAHLNSVLLRLDNNEIPEEPVYISTSALRQKIANTKKIENDNEAKKEEGYILENSIVLPEDITGNFSVVNSYFVLKTPTKGFVKNQLVSKKTVYSLGIERKKLFSNTEKLLIQNKRTKDMYLVDNSFLDNFSVKS